MDKQTYVARERMEQPAIYGLDVQARCVAAVSANSESETHPFLVGTSTCKDRNQLHLIAFDGAANKVSCKARFSHPDEVWGLFPSPSNASLVFTVRHRERVFKSSLWKMNEQGGGADGKESKLQELFELPLPADSGRIHQVLWRPEAAGAKEGAVVSLDEKKSSSGAAVGTSSTSSVEVKGLAAGVWDPHHINNVVTVNERAVRGWDLRTLKETLCIPDAHDDLIRDVDFNPNKPYNVITGGEDRRVRFWDLRKPRSPLKVLLGHSHWVSRVGFNRFHDQLVLSSGTDCLVNLWSISSTSSAPIVIVDDGSSGSSADTGSNERDVDKLVKSFDEHDESVYSIAWSGLDAWVFASLSNDGRVVINHVPEAEKYRILLGQ